MDFLANATHQRHFAAWRVLRSGPQRSVGPQAPAFTTCRSSPRRAAGAANRISPVRSLTRTREDLMTTPSPAACYIRQIGTAVPEAWLDADGSADLLRHACV